MEFDLRDRLENPMERRMRGTHTGAVRIVTRFAIDVTSDGGKRMSKVAHEETMRTYQL